MDVYQRRRLVALSAVAAVFVVLVLLIRSCGDDDDDATPLTSSVPATTGVAGATPLSQEDFASQGDSICLEANTSLAALEETDAAADAAGTAELLAGQLDSLQSLTLAPGEKGETKLENFFAALQRQVQGYDDLATASERGDEAAVTEITATIDEAAAESRRAAKRFGFEVCGDPSEVSESAGGEEESGGAVEEAAGGETVAPVTPTTTPVAPTTTTPVAPPADGGGATPEPVPAPTDDGSSSSGGLTP
jgi:hypothetical protein